MSNPLQAISLDSSLSKQIRGSKAPVCAIESLTGASFQIQNTGFNANNLVASLAAVPVGAGNDALQRSRSIFSETVDVSNRLHGLSGGAVGSGYPPNSAICPARCSSPRGC